jgi:hypothetical protein
VLAREQPIDTAAVMEIPRRLPPTDYLDHLAERTSKVVLVLDDAEIAVLGDALNAFSRVVTSDPSEAHAASTLAARLRALRNDRELARRRASA